MANNDFELQITRDERNQRVVQSVYLIQHAQYALSLSEQRFLLYCFGHLLGRCFRRPSHGEQPNELSVTTQQF